jgi:hypothetical protein
MLAKINLGYYEVKKHKSVWNHSRNVSAGTLKGPFCYATSARPCCRWKNRPRGSNEDRWPHVARPMRERSRGRLALVGYPGLLVLPCRLVFPYFSYKLLRRSPRNAWLAKSKSKSHYDLRSVSQSVSQSVCLGVEPNLGLLTRDFFFSKLLSCLCGAPSLMRSRVCHLSVFCKCSLVVFT